jgi:hypothetical protein
MPWQGPIIAAAAEEAKVMHAMDRRTAVHRLNDDSSRRLDRRMSGAAATATGIRRHGSTSNANGKCFASLVVTPPVLEANVAHAIRAGLAAGFARFCLNHRGTARAILLDIATVFLYSIYTQSMRAGHECLVTKNDNNGNA